MNGGKVLTSDQRLVLTLVRGGWLLACYAPKAGATPPKGALQPGLSNARKEPVTQIVRSPTRPVRLFDDVGGPRLAVHHTQDRAQALLRCVVFEVAPERGWLARTFPSESFEKRASTRSVPSARCITIVIVSKVCLPF